MRLLMLLHNAAVMVARCIGCLRPRGPTPARFRILLTGRFESANWAMAHLRPLAASMGCARLIVVSTYPLPQIPNGTVVCPPAWLVRAIGKTPARLVVFGWEAFRRRPHIVGGFHIKVNALLAAVLAPLAGARSLYFSVGGITEILDGGIWGEGWLFEGMETPDSVVERRLIRAINECDIVITMGSGAAEFLRGKGVNAEIHVIPGGIDGREFRPVPGQCQFDLITTGRLTEVKRVNTFLKTVARVNEEVPGVIAAIVGDGPLREELEQLARDLEIADQVRFAGFQGDVASWLRLARIFVLTSRTEGLSLAMMEAMMCGLPVVVPDVGDLGDLVRDGANGFLVSDPSPETFAARIVALLKDSAKHKALSRAARATALRHELHATTKAWDAILRSQPPPLGSQVPHAAGGRQPC